MLVSDSILEKIEEAVKRSSQVKEDLEKFEKFVVTITTKKEEK